MPSLSEIQQQLVGCLRDPATPVPAFLARPTETVPERRLNVYRNNVTVSLIEALGASFPAVRKLVGEDFFKALARAYIVQEPPRTPLLIHYGGTFGDFIEGFTPAASVPYLADVARLEWLQLCATHARDAAPVGIDGLAGLAERQVASATLELHPSLDVFRSRWPAISIWSDTVNPDTDVAVHMEQGECGVVLRPDLDTDTRILSTGGVAFIEALRDGHPLETAANTAAGDDPDFDLARHLQGLFAIGAVTTININ